MSGKLSDAARNNLIQLREKADAFVEGVSRSYPAEISCQAGCAGCCQDQRTISPVEAAVLLEAIREAPESVRAGIETRLTQIKEESPCVLLDEDRCVAYEARPLICRTHGTLVWLRDSDTRDTCPLNFRERSLEDLPQADFLDVERLNVMLALIQQLSGLERQEHASIPNWLRMGASLWRDGIAQFDPAETP